MAPRTKYRDKARYRWEFRQGFVAMVIDATLDVRVISPHAMRAWRELEPPRIPLR